MKFFVYGKLRSCSSKSWMIPFSKSESHVLTGFKMYTRPDKNAAMKLGATGDFVVGEIREAKWANIWPLGKILLHFLDMNEGTFMNVYKRVNVEEYPQGNMWTYLYEGKDKLI